MMKKEKKLKCNIDTKKAVSREFVYQSVKIGKKKS